MVKNWLKYLEGDKVLWIVTLFLGLISIVSVYSFIPVLIKANGGSTEFYLIKHTVLMLAGFVLMYFIHKMNVSFLSKLARFGIILSVVLLLLTLMFGARVNDAGRWLEIPIINTKFQTSDVAKIFLVIFIAKMLVVNRDKLNSFKEGVMPIILGVGAVCALILPENLSTAVMLFGSSLLLMFIGKVPIKNLLLIVGGAGGFFALLIAFSTVVPGVLPRIDTWKNRMFNQYDNEVDVREEMQVINAQLAIHNGGIIGKGPSKGELKHYIPEAYADFYYASFVEEFGLLGGIVLVLMYMILLFRALRIALKADKLFHTYLVVGLAIILLSQAMVNMAVCTKLIPVTGQNMPLLGMGGTSTWFACISIGIILSVSRSQEQPEKQENEINQKDTQNAAA